LLTVHIGSHPSFKQKISSRKVARIKLGTDTKKVVKKTIILSGSLFRASAAHVPSSSPGIIAHTAASPPSFAEIAKDSPITVEISRPVFSDMPKSP
jgi:hypothetical protein